MTFSNLNLHPDIFKAVLACGYTQPTPVQSKSIPPILEGKDLVASAQTGTGKTAAFVLPALHNLMVNPATHLPRVLILTPTRELADQILKATTTYSKFLRSINSVSLVGGRPYHKQIKDLQRGADIIVATPGRLMDHMEQGRIDLSGIAMLVLDEADRMLDMGFIEDVEDIAKQTPKNRQTLLFSATVDNKLTSVVKHLLKSPVRVDLSSDVISPDKIKQVFYRVESPHQKSSALLHLLATENAYKAIIFSATKINADRIANDLRRQGYTASPLHGDLRQNVRTRTVQDLERGKIQYIVATDVAARGIHINDVSHVINYDLPKFSEDYVHRIGRTGRAGKEGIAISLLLSSDIKNLQRIERLMGQRFQIQRLNTRDTTTTTTSGSASPKLSLSKMAEWTDEDDLPKKRRSSREWIASGREGRPAVNVSTRPPKKRLERKESFSKPKTKSGFSSTRFAKERDTQTGKTEGGFGKSRYEKKKGFSRSDRDTSRAGGSRFAKKESFPNSDRSRSKSRFSKRDGVSGLDRPSKSRFTKKETDRTGFEKNRTFNKLRATG